MLSSNQVRSRSLGGTPFGVQFVIECCWMAVLRHSLQSGQSVRINLFNRFKLSRNSSTLGGISNPIFAKLIHYSRTRLNIFKKINKFSEKKKRAGMQRRKESLTWIRTATPMSIRSVRPPEDNRRIGFDFIPTKRPIAPSI